MWNNLNSAILIDKKQVLCKKFKKYLFNNDYEKCRMYSSLIVFPEFDLKKDTQKYLKLKLPLKTIQIIAQVRLLSRIVVGLSQIH